MLDRSGDHAVLCNMTGEFAFGIGDHAANGQIHVEVVFDEALDGFDLVGLVEFFHKHITCHAKDEGLALHIDISDGVHQCAKICLRFGEGIDERLPGFDDVI